MLMFGLISGLEGCFPTTALDMPDEPFFLSDSDGTDEPADSDFNKNESKNDDKRPDPVQAVDVSCPIGSTAVTYEIGFTKGMDNPDEMCGLDDSRHADISNRLIETFVEVSPDNPTELFGAIHVEWTLSPLIIGTPDISVNNAAPGGLIKTIITQPEGGRGDFQFKMIVPEGTLPGTLIQDETFIELEVWFQLGCGELGIYPIKIMTRVDLCQMSDAEKTWLGPGSVCTICEPT